MTAMPIKAIIDAEVDLEVTVEIEVTIMDEARVEKGQTREIMEVQATHTKCTMVTETNLTIEITTVTPIKKSQTAIMETHTEIITAISQVAIIVHLMSESLQVLVIISLIATMVITIKLTITLLACISMSL